MLPSKPNPCGVINPHKAKAVQQRTHNERVTSKYRLKLRTSNGCNMDTTVVHTYKYRKLSPCLTARLRFGFAHTRTHTHTHAFQLANAPRRPSTIMVPPQQSHERQKEWVKVQPLPIFLLVSRGPRTSRGLGLNRAQQ